MIAPTILGLNGRMGSGKDQTFERLDALYPGRFVRYAFADPLKDAVCALLDMRREDLEEFKRRDDFMIGVGFEDAAGNVPSYLNMRQTLQRFGKEMARDTWGKDFWVDMAMKLLPESDQIPVYTDCRFDNEAASIIDRGGEVWRVIGPDEDTGDHASEQPIQTGYVEHWVRNTERDDNYASLDSQIKQIVDTWEFGA